MTRSPTTTPFWWQWPTILSLDAPVVCLLWQVLIARAVSTRLGWPAVVVLASSVWLAYVADRWIEGWRLDARSIRTARHAFYQRHRAAVAVVWACVLVVDVAVADAALDRDAMLRGSLLLAAVAVYLLSHQLVHRGHPWRAPKEIVVALLLTGGLGVFIWPVGNPRSLAAALACFGTVAFVNVALISSWERDVDRAHGQTSLARDSDRAAQVIAWLPWTVAFGAVAATAIVRDALQVVLACGAVSAAVLGVVDVSSVRPGRVAVRVLADVAMLTPALPLLWSALR